VQPQNAFATFILTAGGSEPSSYTFPISIVTPNLAGVILSYTGGLFDAVALTYLVNSSSAVASYDGANITTTLPSETVVAMWMETGTAITLPGGVTSRAAIVGNATNNSVVVGDYTGPGTPGNSDPGSATGPSTVTWAAVTVSIAVPVPKAPTLNAPINGAYSDIAVNGGPFSWTYNTGGALGGETGYQLRRKTSGSYTYWNATTPAFQSSPVTNTTTSTSITFGAGVWANDTTYNWSAASNDANGLGPFATDFTVNTQTAPVATVTAPTGTWSTNQTPVVTWTDTLDTLGTQSSFRVVTYSAAQYGAGGFVPGSGPSLDDSGVVNSSATTYTVANQIPNNTTVRSYVQITQSPGGQTSAFAFTGYTVSLNAPQTPTLTAVADTDGTTGCPRVKLTVQGYDNFLTANQAAFVNNNTTGWVAGANTAISTVSSPAPPAAEGAFAMQMHPTSTPNTISATTTTGTGGIVVTPGISYEAEALFQSASTGRTCTVGIIWYNSGGGTISTSTGSGIADTNSGWTKATVTATAPALSAFAAIVTTTTTASENHFIAEAQLAPGGTPGWARGGLVGSTTVAILRSDGLYVRGASVANPTSIPSDGATPQQVIVFDYEVTPYTNYTYSAYVSAVTGGNTLTSNPGTSGTVQLQTTQWWELDPTNVATAINAQPTVWNPQTTEQSASHLVLGQTVPNVVANTMGGVDGSGEFQTFTSAIYTGFQSLLTSQKTIFVSDPFGLSYYLRWGPSTGGSGGGSGNKVSDAQLQASTAAAPYRIVQVSWVAQTRPTV
jgi:hypothetical protein